MMIKQNKIKFHNKNIMSIKKIISIGVIFSLFIFVMTLIVTLSSTGFDKVEDVFNVNKNLLIVIPVSSASLSISSLILQQISKNKLADSSILGIGNINLITLMVLMYFLDFNSDYSVNNYLNIYPFVFIIASVFTCFLIYLISYKKNKNISKKFIIVGIILNFTFISLSSTLDSFLPSGKSAALKQFTNGFIDSSSPLPMYVALSGFIIGTIWLAFIFEKFRICCVSFSISKSLGINSNLINLQALLISGLLSSVSYILVGNLSFLGLLSGNIAYSIYKKDYVFTFQATSLIGSIILGIVFLINKNILQSNVNTPGLIPIMGIPYFIYLAAKDK